MIQLLCKRIMLYYKGDGTVEITGNLKITGYSNGDIGITLLKDDLFIDYLVFDFDKLKEWKYE